MHRYQQGVNDCDAWMNIYQNKQNDVVIDEVEFLVKDFNLSVCGLDEKKPAWSDSENPQDMLNFNDKSVINFFKKNPATVEDEEILGDNTHFTAEQSLAVELLPDRKKGDISGPRREVEKKAELPSPIVRVKAILKQILMEDVKDLQTKSLTDLDIEVLRCLLNIKLKQQKVSYVDGVIHLIKADNIEELNAKLKGNLSSEKRNDEQRKFIFKNVIKAMKEEFRKSKNLKKCRQVEEAFWSFFFENYVSQNKIPLSYLYDPLNGSLKKNTLFKNLKQDYFTLILNEDSFYEKFKQHLCKLEEKYINNLDHKIGLALKTLEKTEWNRRSVRRFVRKWESSKSAKFPWSITEIRKTVEDFKVRIVSYRKNGALRDVLKKLVK